MASNKIDLGVVRELAIRLPSVEESTLHDAPCFKVFGRLLTCPALHKSAEPNSLMVRIGRDERAKLMAANPHAFYITDHYRNYPSVLVRLGKIDRRTLTVLLEMSWRFVGSKAKVSRSKPRR